MRTSTQIDSAELRLARQRAGITSRQLAKLAGCSRTHMHYVETGKYSPSPELAYRLAKVLDVEPSTFILAEREPKAS